MQTSSTRFLFLVLPFCILACHPENSGTPKSPSVGYRSDRDSVSIPSFLEKTRQFIHQKDLPDFTQKDTFYVLEMSGSWGELSSWSVLFPDSTGWVAWSDHRVSCSRGDHWCAHASVQRNIGSGQWNEMAQNVGRGNFWTAGFNSSSGCIDCPSYHFYIKHGKKAKLITWTLHQPLPDPVRSLATQLLSVCGRPEYKTIAYYTESKDSVHLRFLPSGNPFFVKSQTLEFGDGRNIPFKEEEISPLVTIPRIYQGIRWQPEVFTKTVWRDGTVEKDLVTVYVKTVKNDGNYDLFFKEIR